MSWTGWMWLTVVTVLAMPFGVALPAAGVADERLLVVKVEPLVALARRAGLRVLAGRRLVLVTDRPERAGDGVADLPTIFDQAFTTWCDHYGLTAADTGDWQALGCLVVHRERFREAGLLPADIP